jgi:hypothetical protein
MENLIPDHFDLINMRFSALNWNENCFNILDALEEKYCGQQLHVLSIEQITDENYTVRNFFQGMYQFHLIIFISEMPYWTMVILSGGIGFG